MKKSQLLKIIKEEIEVVLTNDEAQEIFDLDPAALLENFLEEETAIPRVFTTSITPLGSNDAVTRNSAASPDKRAKDERDEIMAWLRDTKEDNEYSPEEKAEISAQEHIETMVGGFLELIDLPSGSLEAKQFVAAVEQFRQRLLMLARKAAGAAPEDEEADLEEEKKPSSGLSKKQKSKIAKKASAGKDIGKKGKGFKKVAAKAAEKYGSEEAGKRVAAAAMWKNAKR